jgi:hypothetical protein
MNTEFALGVAASIVASALTYLATAVFKLRLPTFATYFFWRKFSKQTVLLISEVPIPYDPKLIKGSAPPLTPMGDAVSLLRIVDFLTYRIRGTTDIVSAPTEDQFLSLRSKNLVIVGGPKYNTAAAQVLSELGPSLPYQFKRMVTPAARSVDDGEMKRIVACRPGLTDIVMLFDDEYDYGMIIVAKSPYATGRYVVVAAGLGTHGSLAATTYLLEARGLDLMRALWNPSGLQLIVRGRAIDPMRVSDIQLLFKRGF